jgi:hypothetical protein
LADVGNILAGKHYSKTNLSQTETLMVIRQLSSLTGEGKPHAGTLLAIFQAQTNTK